MYDSNLVGKVQTVLGLVEPDDLGIALPHEHLVCDVSSYFVEPSSAADKALAYQPVMLENLYWTRYNTYGNLDNLKLLDEEVAIDEATHYKQAGGNTIVDCSSIGLKRDPAALVRIARATGLNIVMGAGYYVQASLPMGFDSKSEKEIADEIVHDVKIGVGSSGVRAGIIGEIGCSWPWTESERKSMKAAVSAQLRTGAAVTIHPGRSKLAPFEIIETLQRTGADLSRVVFEHNDRGLLDFEDLRKLAEASCYLEFDIFGWEGFNPLILDSPTDFPSDGQRISTIMELIAEGYVNQILLSHDICFKTRLVRYGGHGYAHILRNVVGRMQRQGITDEQIQTMVVENPKRLLTFV